MGNFEARSLVYDSESIQIAGGCDLQMNVSLLEQNVFQSYSIFFVQSQFKSVLRDCCKHEYMIQSLSVIWENLSISDCFFFFAVYLLTIIIFFFVFFKGSFFFCKHFQDSNCVHCVVPRESVFLCTGRESF